jgi:hypothetical protein
LNRKLTDEYRICNQGPSRLSNGQQLNMSTPNRYLDWVES